MVLFIKENKEGVFMPESVELFNKIANHYELFNILTSFGVEILWRKRLKKFIDGKNNLILDFGVGTGVFSKEVKNKGIIIGIDPSLKMIKRGREKRGFIKFVNSFGENLPFKNNTFDYVISAYVMRNLENLENGLKEIKRVLKPAGSLIVLEFFPPQNTFFKSFFKIYLGKIVPFFYRFFQGSALPVNYLYNSIYNFMSKDDFKSLLEKTGFAKIKEKDLVFRISFYIKGVKSGES